MLWWRSDTSQEYLPLHEAWQWQHHEKMIKVDRKVDGMKCRAILKTTNCLGGAKKT